MEFSSYYIEEFTFSMDFCVLNFEYSLRNCRFFFNASLDLVLYLIIMEKNWPVQRVDVFDKVNNFFLQFVEM